MTPEERAEKLIKDLYGIPNEPISMREIEVIAAEIRAAVEDQREFGMSITRLQVRRAKAEAYEDAAKIANAHCDGKNNGGYCQACMIRFAIDARAKGL